MNKLIIASAGAFALGIATAGGAAAATTGDTTATFTLTGGALAITVPATAGLSAAGAGGSSTGQLGPVTVTDARAALGGTWTATASSTDFTSSVTNAAAIPKASVGYWSGNSTASSGTAVTVPGQPLAANQVSLTAPVTAYSASATTGNNSTTWNPTITVTVPASAIAGTYSGTVTHSVA